MAYVRKMQGKTRPGSGIASRYRALLLTHNSLEEKLTDELKRPLPDAATVQRLKRRKLAIKDELASIDRLFDAIGASQPPPESPANGPSDDMVAGLDPRDARVVAFASGNERHAAGAPR